MILEPLDTADPAKIAEYEMAFYASFQHVRGNLIRQLWNWDDEAKRLATKIPYQDQVVFVQRDEQGRINGAMGINTAGRAFQGEAFGFAPEPDCGKWCETITFFFAEKSLATLRVMAGLSLGAMAERGFDALYGTTAPHLLKTYLRFGGALLATNVIEGETRHFWRFDLQRLNKNARQAMCSTPQKSA